ncbi:MAG: leucine-rich repeat protein [Coprococcus sp.]
MNMGKKRRKWLSFLLAIVMVFSIVPMIPGISITAKADALGVDEVQVTMELPVSGAIPCNADGVTLADADKYYISEMQWYEGRFYQHMVIEDAVDDKLADGEMFKGNTDYTAFLEIKPKSGYKFDWQNTTVTVNCGGEQITATVDRDYETGSTSNYLYAFVRFTTEPATSYNMTIGGIQVTSDNLVIDSSDTSVISKGSFRFDPATYTLTLDNVTVNSTADAGKDSFICNMESDQKLTIYVKGTNKITYNASTGVAIRSYGKMEMTSDSKGALTIEGSRLKQGIEHRKEFVISGNVELTFNISNDEKVYGIGCISGAPLKIKNAVMLTITTKKTATTTGGESYGMYEQEITYEGHDSLSQVSITAMAEGVGYVAQAVKANYLFLYGGIMRMYGMSQATSIWLIESKYLYADAKMTASKDFYASIADETYDKSKESEYKYVRFERGTEYEKISSLKFSGLTRPMDGEMPYEIVLNVDSENIRWIDSHWVVWDKNEGYWSSWYYEEGEEDKYVEDYPLRTEEMYAFRFTFYPKKGYVFPQDITVTCEDNEMVIPDYDSESSDQTSKSVASDGSSMTVLILTTELPVSDTMSVDSATIDISGYQYGANIKDIKVALDAVGADFYKEEEEIPSGWYIAIDQDGDEEPDGFATGSLKADTNYYLCLGLKADTGYRVTSLTYDKFLLSDGTKPIYLSASPDDVFAVFKLPVLAVPQYNIAVASGKTTASGVSITKAKAGTKVTLTANAAPAGKIFDKWVVISGGITLANAGNATTIFTMPEKAVSVKATYKVAAPAKNAKIKDSGNKAVYRVTKAGTTGGTVEYVAPISKTAKTVTIPSTIKSGGITYKVTSIAKNAFKNNKYITKVTIGKNVNTIGAMAFYKCAALTTVTIGNGVKTIGNGVFGSCSKLTKVTIGKNVTTIGDKAFYKCTALTKITIPSKVSKIGKSAFYGCKKLKSVTIKTTKLTNSKVGNSAFKGIYSKATIKVPKTKVKSYKNILKKRGIGKSVKVKA